MKRTILALILGLAVAVGIPATAVGAESSDDAEQAAEAARCALLAVSDSNDSESYGFDELNLDDVRMGDPIPINGAQAENVVMKCWPLFNSREILAALMSVQIGDEALYRLTTADASELNSFIFSQNGCRIQIEGQSSIAEAPDGSTVDVSELIDPLLIPVDGQLDDGILSCSACISESRDFASQRSVSEMPLLFSEEASFADDSVAGAVNASLKAWRIKQPPGSKLCWAVCASSIGGYLTKQNLGYDAINRAVHGSTDPGGSDADVITALNMFTYPSSSTRVNSFVTTGIMPDATVRNWVASGIPLVAHLKNVSAKIGHDVVVCGVSTFNGSQSTTIMNPATGQYEEMVKNSVGVPSIGSSLLWSYSSIAPVGWQRPYGNALWSYINKNGTRSYGWLKVGNYWYWFDSSGYMTTGWQKVSGKWYWMNSGGAAVTGWQKIGGYWYAFDSSCAMRTGWFKDGSTWYYLRTATNTPASGPEGAMLAGGTWTIGGKAYRFDSSGACLNP